MPSRFTLHPLTIAVLAASVTLPTWADTTPRDTEVRATLPIIEVIGRLESDSFATYTYSVNKTTSPIVDVAQSVSVVTKEVIEAHNLSELNDIYDAPRKLDQPLR